MQSTQFDTITRLFSARRTRREALAMGAGGLAGLGLATVAAQDATPVASPAASEEGVHFMFVQTFGAGSVAPKAGADGVLTLTADHLSGQTIFLSDRPERIVGTVATERFLGVGGASGRGSSATPEGGIGFTPADPPNAALIFDSAAGDAPGDALIVELIDPTYDPATGQVTYELRVLAGETAVDLTLVSEPVVAADAIRQFEGASLFIDDCPNGSVQCLAADGGAFSLSPNPMGFCYVASGTCCAPCANKDSAYWATQCNLHPDCSNSCTAYFDETWAC